MSKELKCYAVREVGTQKYMPAHARGPWTADEPEEQGGALGPRLLPTRRTASAVIANWKKGTHMICRDGYGEDYEEFIDVVAVPERKDVKLEVVCFKLVEVIDA